MTTPAMCFNEVRAEPSDEEKAERVSRDTSRDDLFHSLLVQAVKNAQLRCLEDRAWCVYTTLWELPDGTERIAHIDLPGMREQDLPRRVSDLPSGLAQHVKTKLYELLSNEVRAALN